ncbi:glycosyltransferase [Paraglaciecola sp.]|uniref:glycosyltransferase family 32 protein n=1 Tax=Paraglaciecola sp. TaxID=1920173 RepID=UPI0030F3F92A
MDKIIHYCWFGNGKKSSLIKKCIKSWKVAMPDFEIIEWNESNVDLSENSYVHEAYLSKKWAFVSDYYRLKALYEMGGIYLDTDVEVFKSLEPFLQDTVFSGVEIYKGKLLPFTPYVFGAQKHNAFIKELMDMYADLRFINPDGSKNELPNTVRISELLVTKYGASPKNNVEQMLEGEIHIYPSDYFCEKSSTSFAVHHFSGSWMPLKKKIKLRYYKIRKFLGLEN